MARLLAICQYSNKWPQSYDNKIAYYLRCPGTMRPPIIFMLSSSYTFVNSVYLFAETFLLCNGHSSLCLYFHPAPPFLHYTIGSKPLITDYFNILLYFIWLNQKSRRHTFNDICAFRILSVILSFHWSHEKYVNTLSHLLCDNEDRQCARKTLCRIGKIVR